MSFLSVTEDRELLFTVWSKYCKQEMGVVERALSTNIGRIEITHLKVDPNGFSARLAGRPTTESSAFQILEAEREIDFEEKIATHSALLIQPEGLGFGYEFLKNSIRIYMECNIEIVRVHAGLDIGPYVWARYGFVPNQESWDKLRQVMLDNLENLRQSIRVEIYDELVADLNDTDPKALWSIVAVEDCVGGAKLAKQLLAGGRTSWDGVLDLRDRESMERFNSYDRDAR